MTRARIVIGANYGDEGKGTVVASYAKNAENVLNVLTNGGAQRGHSILTKEGSFTFQHFGSGTLHGADNYYSCYFIINPMKFVSEYESLVVKPRQIYRDERCRWTTPYDSMANLISQQAKRCKATCGMGIWNTIKRFNGGILNMSFDKFMLMEDPSKIMYLDLIREYYEKEMTIPSEWKDIWNSKTLQIHFINDCKFLKANTAVSTLDKMYYDNYIFENGQGLLLCDTGKDTPDTTPSDTGIKYSLELIREIRDIDDITAHYVTRPYLTRHGDGMMEDQSRRDYISRDVREDRTNHFNECQGEFRYGKLDIASLKKRILDDVRDIKFEVELTHCDEMDRVKEFKKAFNIVNTHDTPFV